MPHTVCLALLLGLCAAQPASSDPSAAGIAGPPARQAPATARAAPEEKLWAQIVDLRAEPPTTQPYEAWSAAAIRQRQRLLDKIRLYLTLYPGGPHRAEAVRIELGALHELCALRGGGFEALQARVRHYLSDHPPDSPIAWEAAYWDIVCRRLSREPTATAPAPAPAPDEELLAAYRDYVARHPRSPRVPQMAAALFAQAMAGGDREEMRAVAELLDRNFPDHAVTRTVGAQWRRERAVGEPFWLADDRPDGAGLDTRAWVGHPVLIVAWSSDDPRARRCVQSVEEFRQAHPQVRVVGVNLDQTPEEMRAACVALGIDWPQFNDGLGRANRFARQWGAGDVPRVFVISRRGRLIGSRADETWLDLAAQVLRE